jgi:transcriptional regulator with XRE-family HTH domain
MGERIKAVRTAWGWSQEEMASALRVDQASISFWERDRIVPSGSAMVALAGLIRTSPEALETGKGFVVPAAPAKAAHRRDGRKSLRSLALPSSDPEQTIFVDLLDGSAQVQALADVAAHLADALKLGRRAWVVVE